MTRYFYTDPLAAAWMAKHFGMQVASSVYEDGSYDGFVCGDERDTGAFYIHSNSVHLLEPQVGDIVKNCDDDPARVVSDRHGGRVFTTTLSAARQFVGTEAVIIQRNGKPFFWPESDAA